MTHTGLKEIQKTIIKEVTKPTRRDKQDLIGPSQIGDCAYCVAEYLALSRPDLYPELKKAEDFGLASWLGTAMHSHIDTTFDVPGSYHEQKLDIYNLEGYGQITGHCDWYKDGNLFDWKLVGKYSFDQMKLQYLEKPNQIPKTVYRVQQMLYGYGWLQRGMEVKTVNVVAFPKLSNNPKDIRFYSEPYNQELVDKSLERLEKLWQYVLGKRLEEIPSDEECYRCTRITYRI